MIQVSDIRLSVEADEEGLRRKLSKLLKRPVSELGEVHIVRQSVDARKKDQIQLVYTVQLDLAEESAILRRQLRQVKPVERKNYHFPAVRRQSDKRPVIVGMGPAGLFCALYLARSGVPCTVLEQGRPVEERVRDVESFWRT